MASHNASPHNAVYSLSAEKYQTATWLDTSTLTLPEGSPVLKKSNQIDLDKPDAISWTDLGLFAFQSSPFTQDSLTASFDTVENTTSAPRWTQIKPAQYELDSLSDIRHFSTRQGLPTGAVYKTVQDNAGMLWLATNGEGLCQYIGDHFRCFNESHGLNNNRVWDIETSASGKLILATDNGLNIFDGQKFHTLKIASKSFAGKVDHVAIIDETLFFSSNNALYRFKENALEQISPRIPFKLINDLEADGDTLWIATNSGLFQLSRRKLAQFQFESTCLGPTNAVTSTPEHVYFSLRSGEVCHLNKSTQSTAVLSGINTPNITAMFFDSEQNTLWLGDDSQGVFKVSHQRAQNFNKQNGLSDKHIRNIMKDSQGNIWISTYGGGVNRIKESGFKLLTRRSGLLNERVSALANINEQLWLGQYGTGVQILENNEWLEPIEPIYNHYIHSIAQDQQGRVWLGSRQGITVLGEHSSIHIWREQGLSADIIHQIVPVPNGCLYMATHQGLYRSCDNQLQLLEVSKRQYIIDVFIDHTERVWFVTNGDGTFFVENNTVYRFTESGGLPSNWAYSIEQDENGTVFLGTRTGVLALKATGEQWVGRHISTQEGLSSNIVLGLKYQQGYLWIGTERGNNRLLTKQLFDPDSTLKLDAFVYNNGYLAVDATLNTAAMLDDIFYWGSGSGLTYFKPDYLEIEPSLSTQLLEIASLDKDGEYKYPSTESKNNATLFSPDTLQILFKFTHNDWSSPERAMYQTRLLGSSEIWSEPSISSEITYNHLSPGEYEFQVRASSQDKFGDPVSYSFQLLAPWWQTKWAYALMLALLLMFMYQAMKWRFKILATQQRIKDRAEFSEALLARKKQLLAEVSHEIRTPLSVLKMSIEGLEYNLLDDSEKTYELLHRRIGDINQLVSDIEQLAVSELEERALNCKDMAVKPWLTAWCQDAQTRVAQRPNVQFNFNIKVPITTKIYADIDRLTQVLSNLLSNSLRYSAPPATIELNAYLKLGQLVISIQDSAPGVSSSELITIFQRMYQSEKNKSLYKGGTGLGLAICQDLITRHGGSISATHSELGGVNMTITLSTLNSK
ncbi:sensor histidine kinase [Pseudoalteromonas luteoviolacea]|uniref:sensor histidine kinase n=1 Tax=Pseudoalteromonas luteoviolacea TaxID=43657 RepID=UPI0011AB6FB5|nr:sensor histidine kinase [Pseudoalteromonas luteoviolacea]